MASDEELQEYALRHTRLWPLAQRLDTTKWLSNFTASELPYARAVLRSLIYITDEAAIAQMRAGVARLHQLFCLRQEKLPQRQYEWQAELSRLIVSYPSGSRISQTDSGRHFAELARRIGFDEDQICAPNEIERRARGDFPRVVMFDDILASGHQFIRTLEMQRDGTVKTIYELIEMSAVSLTYIPLLATQRGIAEIARVAPRVSVQPVNTLSPRYSAAHSRSFIWPDKLREGAETFIAETASRAGINHSDRYGYMDLGLAVAFEHTSPPDSTLPIIWTSSDNKDSKWHSLVS